MAKQALQNLKKPPEKLGALLELINGIPSDGARRVLITPEALRNRAEAEGRIDSLAEIICEAIDDLPYKLKNYVLMSFWDGGKSFKGDLDMLKEGGVVERYNQLWDAYITLRYIARRNDKDKKPALWILRPFHKMPVFLEIDEQGMLRDVKPLLFQVIVEGNVEAERIRQCPICKRIFWAGRRTMKCCSPRCANTFRVHRHRYRTDEEKSELKLRQLKREAKQQNKAQKLARPSSKKGKK